MKNETVKQLIQILKKMDQNALVCKMEIVDFDEPTFYTLEICREYKDKVYQDDDGINQKGNIVSFY
ncbi:MAG: hypothetical protein IID16_00860 [Candidatus Marinimicrobia bacterium]|nr:hypothetical protein [Candidatus Neomarinimicrobiota bacterium]